MTIQDLEDKKIILYKYIRGSKSQGTDTETSDIDIGGVYALPQKHIYGLSSLYIPQVANKTNDEVYYELGRYIELLSKGNPTMIESLFVDDEFILCEHPIISEIKKHRDLFITKSLVKKIMGYSASQIQKAQGLNKLLTLPVTEKKGPLEFCYTFYEQGSTKLINWLDNHGLNQKYCGLVNVPNMHDVYGVHYDWRAHLEDNGWTVNDCIGQLLKGLLSSINISDYDNKKALLGQIMCEHFDKIKVFGKDNDFQKNDKLIPNRLGYSGIVAEDGSSNTLRYIQDNYVEKDGVMLNSVAKGAKPICYMYFNASGYAKHLRDYARYQKWLKERNPERYENNKGRKYDAKNMLHSFRLTNMAIEIAKGEGVKVNRRNIDRDFLLSVKAHTYSYEELMDMLKVKEAEMHEAVVNSALPDDVDIEKVNELLVNIRKEFYND